MNEDYIKFLKQFDKQVPDVIYDEQNKFVCGIVFKIKDSNFYAPISSNTKGQQTNMLIRNKHNLPIASIKFSFMIPVPDECLHVIDFDLIKEQDFQYGQLLDIEYEFCIKNEQQILNKASKIYKIGCDKQHILNYTCCDFPLLERMASEYKNMMF